MITPNNHEAERQRVTARFESAVAEEGLVVSHLLTNDELLTGYGDAVIALSQEAYGRPLERTQQWVADCTQALGFRAMVLTTHTDQLVGYTWGTPVAHDPGSDMQSVTDFIVTQRHELGIAEGDELYSTALAIAPEYRGKGLGSGLALAAIRLARQELYADGALLFYRTRRENVVAQRAGVILGAQLTGLPTEYAKDLWMAHIPPVSEGALR